MPSAKGKPTDPQLKEKVTQEIKAKPNKDGSGKGQMAAWKANQIAKEYEARGGDYENEPGSKDKPKKGPPEKKSEAAKSKETKEPQKDHDSDNSSEMYRKAGRNPDWDGNIGDANAIKTDSDSSRAKKRSARPAKKLGGAKQRTSPRDGQRSSEIQAKAASTKGAGEKRKSSGGDQNGSAKKAKK